MSEYKKAVVGDVVIFRDPSGKDHNAIVTIDHGGCINLLHVSSDSARQDQYGRQIERPTSVSHQSQNQAHGFNWRWPDEKPNEYQPPVSR